MTQLSKEMAELIIGNCHEGIPHSRDLVSASDEGSDAYHGLVERSGIFIDYSHRKDDPTTTKEKEDKCTLPVGRVHGLMNGHTFRAKKSDMVVHTCKCRSCSYTDDPFVLCMAAKRDHFAPCCDMSGIEGDACAFTFIRYNGATDTPRESGVEAYGSKAVRLWGSNTCRPAGAVVCSLCLSLQSIFFGRIFARNGNRPTCTTVINVSCPYGRKRKTCATYKRPYTDRSKVADAYFTVIFD